MIQHPAAQKKAQEELDLVVGTDRLPTFEDRTYLPYGGLTMILSFDFSTDNFICSGVHF